MNTETILRAWEEARNRWDRLPPFKQGGALVEAGDALAGLVPQFLEQLEGWQREAKRKDGEASSYLYRLNNAESMCAAWKVEVDKVRAERDALESEKAQLLDQLAEKNRELEAAWGEVETVATNVALLDTTRVALGERCRQAELRVESSEVQARAWFESLKVSKERCRQLETALERIGAMDWNGISEGLSGPAIAREALRGDAAVSPEPEQL